MSNLNNISIILVRPQMGENIGAAVRVMKNFELSDLRIVDPRDGWPNEKAYALSAGAKDLLDKVKIFQSTEDAIADLDKAYATTARKRGMIKPITFPETLGKEISESEETQKIGILFGQENNGLDNDDISNCNAILTIPIGKKYSSLNLAQSVAIVCYELFKNSTQKGANLNLSEKKAIEEKNASKKEVLDFIKYLEQKMDAENFYSVPEKKDTMMVNIKNIFTRHDFTKQEISTLRGIFKGKES